MEDGANGEEEDAETALASVGDAEKGNKAAYREGD